MKVVKYKRANGTVGYGKVNENPTTHHLRHGARAIKEHSYLAVGVGLVLGGLAGYAVGVNKTSGSANSAIDGVPGPDGRLYAAINQNATRNRQASYRFPAMLAEDDDVAINGRRNLGYGLSIIDNVPQSSITKGRGTQMRPV
jgi:hypothetical protein